MLSRGEKEKPIWRTRISRNNAGAHVIRAEDNNFINYRPVVTLIARLLASTWLYRLSKISVITGNPFLSLSLSLSLIYCENHVRFI